MAWVFTPLGCGLADSEIEDDQVFSALFVESADSVNNLLFQLGLNSISVFAHR